MLKAVHTVLRSDSVSYLKAGSVLLSFSARPLFDRLSAKDDFVQSVLPAAPGYPDTDPEGQRYLLPRTGVRL